MAERAVPGPTPLPSGALPSTSPSPSSEVVLVRLRAAPGGLSGSPGFPEEVPLRDLLGWAGDLLAAAFAAAAGGMTAGAFMGRGRKGGGEGARWAGMAFPTKATCIPSRSTFSAWHRQWPADTTLKVLLLLCLMPRG